MFAESSRFVGFTLTALLSAATIAWGQSSVSAVADDGGRNPGSQPQAAGSQPQAAGATTSKPAKGAQTTDASRSVQPANTAKPAAAPAQPKPSAPAAREPKAAAPPVAAGGSPFKTAQPAQAAPRARAAANPAVRSNGDNRVNMRPAVYKPNPFPPIQTDPRAPDYYEPAHRTVVRPRRLPERDANGYGFRNPGGVGRYDEYLPPAGDMSVINPAKPMRMAVSGGTNFPVSRQEQIMMRNAGTAQAGMLNSQMGMYARPFGFGGFGYGGGMMYGYGMPF